MFKQSLLLTRAPTGVWVNFAPTRRGEADTRPLVISETMRPSENSKKHKKALVEPYNIYGNDFEARSILRSPEVIKGQVMAKFHTFFRKYVRISETILGRSRKKHSRALQLFFR